MRRHSLRLWLVLVLALAAVLVLGTTVPLPSEASTAGAAAAGTADGNGGYLYTLPCPAGQTTNCPTIDVGPVSHLNDGQYAFVTAKNFDPTSSIRVAFCAADTSATDPSCLSGNWETQSLRPTTVPVTNDPATQNLTSLSYPVFSDPAGQGNSAIPAHDLVNQTGPAPGFYCDNTVNPCELVVTDEPGQGAAAGNGPTITPDNSAVVPLSFATASAGCPAGDSQVQVDSAFSLEHFIPAAVEATCTGAKGVVALNTSNDDTSVVNDFASGGTTIAFVDNASDPGQLASLLGKSYAYIPIALSGTTESFLAGASNQGQNFPINSYDLTPNMVSGLITSLYQQPVGSYTQPPKPRYTLADNLVAALATATPPVTCAQLVGCPSTQSKAKQFLYLQKYDAFDMLNPYPAGDYGPATFGSFNANVPSGSSYQATSWLCSAPNAPFAVPVSEVGQSSPVPVTVQDGNTAPATLTTAPVGSSIWPPYQGAPWVYPSCQGYSTFPALSATANNYGPAQSPAFQAKAMRSWCYGGSVLPQPQNPQDPCAAFGIMDTSEAQYFGLSSASLENASGTFVSPTVASLEAGAAGLTACPSGDLSCPAGTYKNNYADPNPAAYPMANITYAIVPTSQLNYAAGTAVKDLLDNLLSFSHSSDVPAGYAPLPDAIYQAAVNDVAKDISVAAAPPGSYTGPTYVGGTSTSSASAPPSLIASPGGSSGSASGSSSAYGSTEGSSTTTSALPLTSTGSSGGSPGSRSGGTPVPAPSSSLPGGFLLVGLSATTRFLLPAIVILALGSLVGGLLLLYGPGAAARRREDEPGGTT